MTLHPELTYSPEPIDAPGLATIIMTEQWPNGAMLGRVQPGDEACFLSATAAKVTGAQVGESLLAEVLPNRRLDSGIPWFACRVVARHDDSLTPEYAATIEQTVRAGGVWQACQFRGASVAAASAVLEALYRRGGLSKFVRFDHPDQSGAEVWYTAFPGRADVDEWEDPDCSQETRHEPPAR